MIAASRLTRNCIIVLSQKAELCSTRSNLNSSETFKAVKGGQNLTQLLQEIKSLAKTNTSFKLVQ